MPGFEPRANAGIIDIAPFGPSMTKTIAAIFDTVVPGDAEPGGWAGGGESLLREQIDGFLDWAISVLSAAAIVVDDAARASFGRPFDLLPPSERTRLLTDALAAEAAARDNAAREDTPIDTVINLVHQAYYGGVREPAGWRVAGFRPIPAGVEPIEPEPERGVPLDRLEKEYDVIIIGAGAGGGFAAAQLADRGRRVLLIERSRPFSNADLRGNHLQGKRQELFDVTAGPGRGSPRVLERSDGSTELLSGAGSGTAYGLVAMTLGGGTRVWQAMAWRFLVEDFAMATTYGVPEASTLVDWPFDYEELEPYYERVEWELGVAGDSRASAGTRAPRKLDLPMPAVRDNGLRRPYAAAASRLGWETSPVPLAINSVPHDGRPACVGCPQCVGHACPVDAKNGTHNTVIPRALATGNCDLLMATQAVEIFSDGRGRAHGVRAFHDVNGAVTELTIRAKQIVVAAGALETPRLLLASRLGNEWVGRNHRGANTQGVRGARPLNFDSRLRPSRRRSLGWRSDLRPPGYAPGGQGGDGPDARRSIRAGAHQVDAIFTAPPGRHVHGAGDPPPALPCLDRSRGAGSVRHAGRATTRRSPPGFRRGRRVHARAMRGVGHRTRRPQRLLKFISGRLAWSGAFRRNGENGAQSCVVRR
jgi:ferredoxin